MPDLLYNTLVILTGDSHQLVLVKYCRL